MICEGSVASPDAASGSVKMDPSGHSHEKNSQPAGYPFNNPKADVILRSSDETPTDFRVFKLLLSLASSFFDLIFTLPQPSKDNAGTSVIAMAEDKRTLELVLGLCYPVSVGVLPHLSSLVDLQLVMKAATKFEMKGIQRHVRKVLVEPRFIECQPLRVFAIACHYGWALEARDAAHFTLQYSTTTSDTIIDELDLISASTYHCLLRYQKQCGDAAASYVSTLARKSPAGDWVWETCSGCTLAKGDKRWKGSGQGSRKWWVDWMDCLALELRNRPSGKTINRFDLREIALAEASICNHCGENAKEDLDSFITTLAANVEKVISKIALNLDFRNESDDF